MRFKYLIGVTFIAGGLAGCQQHSPKEASPGSSASPLSVQVIRLEPKATPRTVAYSGTVRARREAVLSTKLAGRIQYLQAEEGDVVSAGSVVAEIDVSDLVARTEQAEAGRNSAVAALAQTEAGYQQALAGVVQAEAQWKAVAQQQSEVQARLALAEKDYQRYQMLAKEGAIPRQRADQALSELQVIRSKQLQLRSQMTAAQVGIREAQAGVSLSRSGMNRSQAGIAEAEASVRASSSDLQYGKVLAPFRGVVVQKNAYQGELNTPGRALLKIQDLNSLEVSLTLPEAALERVQPGKELSAELPGSKQHCQVQVRQVVASTDPTSRTVEARLRFLQTPPRVFPGAFVRVTLSETSPPRNLLPVAAVATRGQLEGAFVVAGDSSVEFRLLQLGEREGDSREVLSGLNGGEQVVLSPPEGLRDGQKVVLR